MDLRTLIAHSLGRGDDQVALESGAQTWSYAELDRVTRDRAALLRRSAPDMSRVAFGGEHTADALIWALSVMRSGLVYTPFNPGLPVERMRELLNLAGPALVLCSAAVADVLRHGDTGCRVVTVDELAAAPPGEAGEQPASWPVPDTAYSIFTSGSSGLPKLVHVGHRGIESLCRAQTRLFGLTPGMRVLQFSSLSFDASIAEILVTLYAGGTLVVPEWDGGGSWVNAVAGHLHDHGCDLITLPPSVYSVLRQGARRGIKTLVFAGEALSEAEYLAASRHSRVFNAYGPTEGTVCFSVAELKGFTTSVGPPIDGYRARIYDVASGTYADAGRGELVIIGDAVALGYEGTAPDNGQRFTTVGGMPAYHTGDEVELRNGEVFYLGRLDDQIKRLGHRINLTGLQGRLSQLLDSRVVVLTEGSSLVLAHTVADWPEAQLRTRLREALPVWEVPDVVVVVPEIPLTDAGKADTDALRALVRQGAGAQPGGGTELEVVSGVVEKVLGSEIDPATSVFDAGGSSFTLVQIQVELAALFGEQPVQDAFDQLNYDFTADGFLAALRGQPGPDPYRARELFGAVASDLVDLRKQLASLRPAQKTAAPTITLTGAGGFIGGHVLDRVLGSGRPVRVVTTSSPERLIERHCARFQREASEFAAVRITGYDELEGVTDEGDSWGVVLHCGFDVNHALPLRHHINGSVATTRTLVRAASARGAHRFVFLSAASVGPRFLPFTADVLDAIGDPYSQAKFVAEAYVEAMEGATCAVDLLRVGLVYGHQQSERMFVGHDVFATLLRLSQRHGALPRMSGLVPVCHVDDVVEASLTAATGGGEGSTRSVLVHRTYDLDALRDELGLSEVRLMEPEQWLDIVTEGGSADPRMLTALRLWLGGEGWVEPVRTTDRPILRELQLVCGD